MLRETDIRRVAVMMIARHKTEAIRRALKRADDLRPTEPQAAESWMRVVASIRQIEAGP